MAGPSAARRERKSIQTQNLFLLSAPLKQTDMFPMRAPCAQNAASICRDATILSCFRDGGLGKPTETNYPTR